MKDIMKHILFLLGGYDLEMQVIAQVLKEKKLSYKDYSLKWDSAYLSNYKEVLEEYGNSPLWTIYGVELQEDIPMPDNYVKIDHHNDYSEKASVLEQVMALLNLPLTRYQQLVAANDSAYIPGMLKKNATLEEISKIRRADRKAQGITEKEEELACKAIAENSTIMRRLVIVRALSARFSPICDLLFPYNNLLIYTTNEWIFYGEDAVSIKEKFMEDILSGNIFYGGGDNGYVGTVTERYTTKEINRMIEHIKKLYL